MRIKRFKIRKIVQETPDVKSFYLVESRKNKAMKFKPGQYVNVHLVKGRGFEDVSRSYSISNCPGEDFLSITVKKAGEISSKLHSLEKGGKIGISGPFGFFTLENIGFWKDMIFIAGGIGITPIRSMIRHLAEQKSRRRIQLFYSNKKEKDIVFRREFDELAKIWKKFHVFYTLTQENRKMPGIQGRGRLNGGKIKKWAKGLKSSYCFICGSIDFVNSLWEDLKKVGVKEEFIKTETFY